MKARLLSRLPRASPHVASILRHHGLTRFAAPRLLELGHILHHTIHPVFSRGMGIGQHPHPRHLRTPLLAPHPSESQEVALLRRVAVDLLTFFSSLVLRNEMFQRCQRN